MRQLTDEEREASASAFEFSVEGLSKSLAIEHLEEARDMIGDLTILLAKAAAIYGPYSSHAAWFQDANLMLAQIYQSSTDEFQGDVDTLKDMVSEREELVETFQNGIQETIDIMRGMGYGQEGRKKIHD